MDDGQWLIGQPLKAITPGFADFDVTRIPEGFPLWYRPERPALPIGPIGRAIQDMRPWLATHFPELPAELRERAEQMLGVPGFGPPGSWTRPATWRAIVRILKQSPVAAGWWP